MKLICPNKCRVYLARGMYLYIGIAILLVPIRLLIAMCISAVTHELFHILALKVCRVPIYSIKIGPLGAAIHTQMMPQIQELFCALAGPIGALILLIFAKWMPIIALCAFFQTLYNLLPIYPFDGGRALRCVINLVLPQKYAEAIFDSFQRAALAAIIIAAVYAFFRYQLGVLSFLMAAFPVLGNKNSLQR